MQLTEGEMATLIENIITPILFSDDPGDWNYVKAAEEAAHAIAERMRVGVVFEDAAEAHSMGYSENPAVRLVCINSEKMQLNLYGLSLGDIGHIEGERVRVTVTREESDAEKGCMETL